MKKSNKAIGSILLSLAASIWGGMFVVVKNIVTTIPPVELVWCRYVVAVIFLLLFCLIKGIKWHWDWRNGSLLILAGIIGDAISIVTQETGTWLSSAQTGAVITASTPTFMVIFAWLLLHERVTRAKVVSLILATTGVLIIVGVHFTGAHVLTGCLFLIIAALTWALMSVINKMVAPQYDVLEITTAAAIVAIICLTPFVFANWSTTLGHVDFRLFKVWGSLLYLGAISTATAFVMWNRGVQLLNAASSGLFFLFQPIVGTLLGWLLLNEQITWTFVLGSLLIAGSIWYSIRFA
ncbi:DMT family transporter [Limosilactobacillus sp.]|jgi:drug/metabolite transporter (DMT)-like permease|uniref:DMT family transporter n=1 Tax=Limosilactobacillus sp. TaxID=2773925 RepID=UPI00345E5E77